MAKEEEPRKYAENREELFREFHRVIAPVVVLKVEGKMTKKTYHIYLNDKCLFKNLNEEEFDIIWNKLYTSYWKEEITYTEVYDQSMGDSTIYEHSY